ncbi:MAG: winged helix-turn-helix domain-containing protein [Thermoplasmata archaeon]|nr:winged helix-turn-helix domain-containing protein [Thermoplasmata archaeon]
MQTVKMITDPEAFQLLADETRRKIIYLLRVKDMTVSQIAEQMQLTTQAIYHHVRKLKDADMIEVAKEERIGHFIETYYRTTAEIFHLSHGESTPQKDREAQIRGALGGLEKLGMKVDCSPSKMKEILRITKEMDECCTMAEWTEKASGLGLDFMTQQLAIEYAYLMSMTEAQYDLNQAQQKQIWSLLKSCVEVPEMKKKKNVKKK